MTENKQSKFNSTLQTKIL